jgi:hypothetical protein
MDDNQLAHKTQSCGLINFIKSRSAATAPNESFSAKITEAFTIDANWHNGAPGNEDIIR